MWGFELQHHGGVPPEWGAGCPVCRGARGGPGCLYNLLAWGPAGGRLGRGAGGRGGLVGWAAWGGGSIDMGGLAIRGSQGSLGGIQCATPGPDYVEVCDGYIRDMNGDGFDGGGARMVELDDLHIDHCATGA